MHILHCIFAQFFQYVRKKLCKVCNAKSVKWVGWLITLGALINVGFLIYLHKLSVSIWFCIKPTQKGEARRNSTNNVGKRQLENSSKIVEWKNKSKNGTIVFIFSLYYYLLLSYIFFLVSVWVCECVWNCTWTSQMLQIKQIDSSNEEKTYTYFISNTRHHWSI